MAMSDIARRHQLILQRLPREPRKITVQALQTHLDNHGLTAGLRTIQRDLQKMSVEYPLVEVSGSGRGNEGAGWALAKDSKPIIRNLDPSSALSIVMAHQYLQPLIPASLLEQLSYWVEAAEKTLEQFNGRGFKSWPQKIAVKPRGQILKPAHIDSKALTIIQQALLENKQLEVTYLEKQEQRIHPLGLIHRGPIMYLVCRFFDYEDIRLTALHRFTKANILEAKIKVPEGFDLKKYMETEFLLPGDTGKEILLKICFTDHAGDHLQETPLSHTQKIVADADGTLTVTARVMETSELYWWLLGFADAVEVQSPKHIRDWFKEIVSKMANMY